MASVDDEDPDALLVTFDCVPETTLVALIDVPIEDGEVVMTAASMTLSTPSRNELA